MKRHLNDGLTLYAGWVAVIFQGIRTSIAKEPYIFVIFQGDPNPLPSPPGSANDEDAALGFCQFILILLHLLRARFGELRNPSNLYKIDVRIFKAQLISGST